ncbi:FGGY family carbohydrate kinase [Paracoccus sp. AS002]|uniref:FGGY family carbohydrate kinase n=1 Tax=Paracoccus sp. AS002 TaxID=3019545 RepID=UPI0023E8ACAF|nr:FGGY family carbohydrate kinase [Paracoccus sp. AS002]MDF3906953.1 FGGY family carbohydrate kinase [Paracoccus sp. AS002]
MAVLLCLDSGTTSVKAAAFDEAGRLLAQAERPNGALQREGARVEQDMHRTRAEALSVLRDCAAQATGPFTGLIVTGQGDGLWPVDAGGQPVGRALTWLDGRARGLVAAMAPALDTVQAATGSRPTAASASLQLLWLQQNDPARHARITHALRLKEWLFLALTGQPLAEPTALLPVWGDWRSGALAPVVAESLGLSHGTELLPDLAPVGAARAGLSQAAAEATGLPQGLPVLLGPGDVQATLIGLGLGSRAGVGRASIFGTSAIHACLLDDPAAMPQAPAGAMIQQFALGPGYLCFHPCFNGATLLHHLSRRFADLPAAPAPDYSALILHPFLEPGGERAPWTDPHASGAVIGLTAASTPAQIAWAGREALAFVTRASHAMMGAPGGALSLGGGLAGDEHFAQFLATVTGCTVQRRPGSHAGLRGLAAIAARFLLDARDPAPWIGSTGHGLAPDPGPVAAYAEGKYRLFAALLEAVSPFWEPLSDLREQAEKLMETP